jgi:hypothetical protein
VVLKALPARSGVNGLESEPALGQHFDRGGDHLATDAISLDDAQAEGAFRRRKTG